MLTLYLQFRKVELPTAPGSEILSKYNWMLVLHWAAPHFTSYISKIRVDETRNSQHVTRCEEIREAGKHHIRAQTWQKISAKIYQWLSPGSNYLSKYSSPKASKSQVILNSIRKIKHTKYLFTSVFSHNFQQSNCTNKVVVIIHQGFLHTFANCF